MSLRALAVSLLVAAFVAAGCSSDEPEGAAPTGATEPTATAPGAEPPAGDEPVPVEGDGGIGGEGGGPVTSNLILSSEDAGADQVEVTGTCLAGVEPPTYRLDLAGGGVLTVAAGDAGGGLELELDGTTYRSPEDQPPVATTTEGALSVQGRAVADDGDERFVDAVIGLDDLPDC